MNKTRPTIAEIDEADSDNGCYEPISPSLAPINRLLKQRDDAVHLLGMILSTLKLSGNQEHKISELQTKGLLSSWECQFEKVSSKPVVL